VNDDGTAAAFDALMARLDPAMVVLTTAAGDQRAGSLVGFHAQCAIAPPRYAVWMSRANDTYRVGALAEHFAVHLLHEGHRGLAELFGGTSGDDIDKFARCRWTPGPGGVPLLEDCPDRFVGRRVGLVDVDTDHVCVVLEPVSAEVGADHPRLRLHHVEDIEPGHRAEERHDPT
jgi:flavin reductase (DIM6/NTAB) family NADH-FMN oxidoreductase RutF